MYPPTRENLTCGPFLYYDIWKYSLVNYNPSPQLLAFTFYICLRFHVFCSLPTRQSTLVSELLCWLVNQRKCKQPEYISLPLSEAPAHSHKQQQYTISILLCDSKFWNSITWTHNKWSVVNTCVNIDKPVPYCVALRILSHGLMT